MSQTPPKPDSSLTLSIAAAATALLGVIVVTGKDGKWRNMLAGQPAPQTQQTRPAPIAPSQASPSPSPYFETLLPIPSPQAPRDQAAQPAPPAETSCTAKPMEYGRGAHLFQQPSGCRRLRVTLAPRQGAMPDGPLQFTLNQVQIGLSFSILVGHGARGETRLHATGNPEPLAWAGTDEGGGVAKSRGIGFEWEAETSFSFGNRNRVEAYAILEPLP